MPNTVTKITNSVPVKLFYKITHNNYLISVQRKRKICLKGKHLDL